MLISPYYYLLHFEFGSTKLKLATVRIEILTSARYSLLTRSRNFIVLNIKKRDSFIIPSISDPESSANLLALLVESSNKIK
jgi:nucleosome binding factor SPN SPT16 subunit